jgi:hypothetical protein
MRTKIPVVKSQVIHLFQIEGNAVASQIVVLSACLSSHWAKYILDLWVGGIRSREQVAVKTSEVWRQ